MYYVYILRCTGDQLYTGITTDVTRRVRQHLGQIRGGAKYTASHPPRAIAMVWQAPDQPAAAILERAVKGLKRRDKDRLLADPALLGTLCPSVEPGIYAPRPDLTAETIE